LKIAGRRNGLETSRFYWGKGLERQHKNGRIGDMWSSNKDDIGDVVGGGVETRGCARDLDAHCFRFYIISLN
jgi:hypothetical protein